MRPSFSERGPSKVKAAAAREGEGLAEEAVGNGAAVRPEVEGVAELRVAAVTGAHLLVAQLPVEGARARGGRLHVEPELRDALRRAGVPLRRLHEGQAFHFLEPGEDVAMLATGKAMVEALVVIDEKRRRAFFLEGRQADEFAALGERMQERGPDRPAPEFGMLDGNGDGVIDEHELGQEIARHMADRRGGPRHDGDRPMRKGEARPGDRADRFFDRLDADEDGAVSRAEFAASPMLERMERVVARLDADGDGAVSLDEAKAMRVEDLKALFA